MGRQSGFRPLVVTGVIGTFLYWCEFSALKVGLPIAHLSFLSLTVPAWVLLYEYFNKDAGSINLNKWLMAMLGSIVMILPVMGGEFSLGHILPIFSSFLFAAFIISSKRSQDAGISPIVCCFFNDLFPLIGVMVLMLINGKPDDLLVMPPEPTNMFLFSALIGLLPGLIFLYGLKETDLTTASFIVIIEPILLGVIAVVFSDGPLTFNFLAGALMIMIANMPDFFFSSLRRVRADYAAFMIIK